MAKTEHANRKCKRQVPREVVSANQGNRCTSQWIDLISTFHDLCKTPDRHVHTFPVNRLNITVLGRFPMVPRQVVSYMHTARERPQVKPSKKPGWNKNSKKQAQIWARADGRVKEKCHASDGVCSQRRILAKGGKVRVICDFTNIQKLGD